MSGRARILLISRLSRSTIGFGRAGRRHHADPDGGVVFRNAGLRDGRHVRQDRRAYLARGAERLDAAVLDRRRHGRHRVEHHVDLARHDVGARAGRALVGNVHDVEAGEVFHQLARHVIVRAGAGRAVVQRAGLGPGERDQLLQGVHRRALRHHQHQLGIHQRGDRHEVAHQPIGLVRIERLDRGLGRRDHQQGVAVRRGFRGFRRADDGAGARAVLHHDRLTERLAQLLAERAGEYVGRPARAERHDHADGAVRIVLRGSRKRQGDQTIAANTMSDKARQRIVMDSGPGKSPRSLPRPRRADQPRNPGRPSAVCHRGAHDPETCAAVSGQDHAQTKSYCGMTMTGHTVRRSTMERWRSQTNLISAVFALLAVPLAVAARLLG